MAGRSGMVNCVARTRNPEEPVSTRTFVIVWQLEEPGTQMVTLASSEFFAVSAGPEFTATDTEFPVVPVPPPPPPVAAEPPTPLQAGRAKVPAANAKAHPRFPR